MYVKRMKFSSYKPMLNHEVSINGAHVIIETEGKPTVSREGFPLQDNWYDEPHQRVHIAIHDLEAALVALYDHDTQTIRETESEEN